MYITNEMYKTSYKEVFLLLMSLPLEYIKLIPQEKIKYYYENMDNNYDYNIDYNKKLYEQEMSEVTKAILTNLYRDYLVIEEKKSNIIKKENEELIAKEEEKRQKYNPDDLFKKSKTQIEEIQEETSLVEYKESVFKGIVNKIKRIFHIN